MSGSVNNLWDSGDVQIDGVGIYNSGGDTYDFTNLTIPVGTNIVVTIDTAPIGINGRTFRGAIHVRYIICSNK